MRTVSACTSGESEVANVPMNMIKLKSVSLICIKQIGFHLLCISLTKNIKLNLFMAIFLPEMDHSMGHAHHEHGNHMNEMDHIMPAPDHDMSMNGTFQNDIIQVSHFYIVCQYKLFITKNELQIYCDIYETVFLGRPPNNRSHSV